MKTHIRFAYSWVQNERVRITKYLITGFSAVGLDAGLYILLTRVFDISEVPANVCTTTIAATFVFLMNKYWSFNNHTGTLRQTRRYLILFAFNYLSSQTAFYLLVEKVEAHDLIVKFALIGVMTTWNFLLYKYWVYAME